MMEGVDGNKKRNRIGDLDFSLNILRSLAEDGDNGLLHTHERSEGSVQGI